MVSILDNVSSGSNLPGDLIVYSHLKDPSIIDRETCQPLIKRDTAGFLVLHDTEATKRLLFCEDLKTPTFNVLTKSEFINRISSSLRFDPKLADAYSNGIPSLTEIYTPNISGSLSVKEILDIADYYESCDYAERFDIQKLLSQNGAFVIPRLPVFDLRYTESLNGLKLTANSRVVSDGWIYRGDVIKKQILTS
jgi:hypothetical protein